MFTHLSSCLSLIAGLSLLQPQHFAAAYKPLPESFLRAIPSPGHDLDPHNGSLLAPILIPRVPGTPGQVTAQNHIVDYFQRELPEWSIAWQNSTAVTPTSKGAELPFANLIFRREPPWVSPEQANYLTLVAHYDSKIAPEGFIGATDSAAPCAMLMYIAKVIDGYMSRMHNGTEAPGEAGAVEKDMGIQILLLDGEEAFENWTDEDSLYGSRSLAEEWSSTFNPPSANFYKYRTPLSQISLFVLLDLLGSASPHIPSYFATTHWAYKHVASIESRMRALDLLESSPTSPFLPDAGGRSGRGGISDDHLPFIARGVEILHLIPNPFPKVWHTMDDDGEHLDMETVRDWAKIMAAFTLEWLDASEVWDERGGTDG